MSIYSKIASHLPERFAIARECVPALLLMTAVSVTLWCGVAIGNSKILFWGAVLLTIAIGTLAFFFRNPHRTIPALTNRDILSPADGKIISIGPASEPEFLKKDVVRVSIFLSLFDVHVNRIPVSGVVKFKQCSAGKFLPAFLENASNSNKCVAVGIKCDDGFSMTVVQITGFFTRRIMCHLDLGQHVDRGNCYGMICFGSRVDIFVPRETSFRVQIGDRVYGGITVIGQKSSSFGKNKISSS